MPAGVAENSNGVEPFETEKVTNCDAPIIDEESQNCLSCPPTLSHTLCVTKYCVWAAWYERERTGAFTAHVHHAFDMLCKPIYRFAYHTSFTLPLFGTTTIIAELCPNISTIGCSCFFFAGEMDVLL